MTNAAAKQPLTPPSADEVQRNRAAIDLLRSWLADDSGYDEATFPELKKALEGTRRAVQASPLFDD